MLGYKFYFCDLFFSLCSPFTGASQVVLVVKEPTCQCRRQEMQVQSLAWEDPLEEGMATYSSVLAWRIPVDR